MLFLMPIHMKWERVCRKLSPLPLKFNRLRGHIHLNNSRAAVIRRLNGTRSGHHLPNVHFYTRKKETPKKTYTTSSIRPSYQLVEPSCVMDLAINTETAMATSSTVVNTIFMVFPIK